MARHYGVHPTLIHGWKKQLANGAEKVFGSPAKAASADAEARQTELFEQIGRLKMELEWVKKKWPPSAEDRRAYGGSMMPMEDLEFARKWIEETWHDNFQCAIIIYHPERYDFVAEQRLPRKTRTQNARKLDEMHLRMARAYHLIEEGLRSSEMTPDQARELLAQEGVADRVQILTTKDGLIAAIADILGVQGANAWDNQGHYAWDEKGIFSVSFWHDPAH